MLPEPTERLRFRPMTMADLDDMTTLLSAPDPVLVDRPARDRDDAVHWIEWQERNYSDHGFGLWVVETHEGEFVGDCGLTVQDVEGEPHVDTAAGLEWHQIDDFDGREKMWKHYVQRLALQRNQSGTLRGIAVRAGYADRFAAVPTSTT